jgi:autoinducer 2 (AI-2) kinase
MEEAAYVSRAHYAILREVCGVGPERVRFVGGPSHSSLWPRILADVLGLPVEVPAVAEATCLGAAVCALVGSGVFSSLAEGAQATVQIERTVDWDPAAHLVYDAAFARRRALYDHMLAAADQSLAAYLWQGAGAGHHS